MPISVDQFRTAVTQLGNDISEAQEKGLSPEKAKEFLLQYTTGIDKVGVGFDMPEVSQAIKNALRDAAVIKDQNGKPTGQYRALSDEEARQIATDAAHSHILGRHTRPHQYEYGTCVFAGAFI